MRKYFEGIVFLIAGVWICDIACAWNLSNALYYAEDYCDASNPNFCNLDSNDCANFLSQILTKGCQNLCESPYAECSTVIDGDGACADCNGTESHQTIQAVISLKTHFEAQTVYYQKVRNPNETDGHWESPGDVPSYVGAGDIILFFNANASHRHSSFCGDWGTGYSVPLYMHGSYPCGTKTLSEYWGKFGPGGTEWPDYFDRFFIYKVIASPTMEKEISALGGIK